MSTTTETFHFTRKRITTFACCFVVGIGADQLSKIWARDALKDHSIFLGSSKVGFSLTTNSGSAFSLFQSSTIYLTLIALLVVGILVVATFRTRDTWSSYIYMTIAVGATGNIIDRFSQPPHGGHGHVTDFIRVGSWPTFNIADSLITLGALGLVGATFFHRQGQTLQEEKGHDES